MGQLILQQGVNGYQGCECTELRVKGPTYYAKVPPDPSTMLVLYG